MLFTITNACNYFFFFFFALFLPPVFILFCLSFVIRYVYNSMLCLFIGCGNIIIVVKGFVGLLFFVQLNLK